MVSLTLLSFWPHLLITLSLILIQPHWPWHSQKYSKRAPASGMLDLMITIPAYSFLDTHSDSFLHLCHIFIQYHFLLRSSWQAGCCPWTLLNWSRVDIQCNISFRCTVKWFDNSIECSMLTMIKCILPSYLVIIVLWTIFPMLYFLSLGLICSITGSYISSS